ncbi:uncharacterized protein LOC131190986 isoform X2 [Ahaetulla prasina]|uniref:uncharacterized protein LOC131190986 isoform X2 n=1 Tax=Ahaetulla prasina TaxID=499056 RepID=UPI0026482614|nr:uncharacterized protein LOC131190986 isoform X2 [Ahaetulla prasina]
MTVWKRLLWPLLCAATALCVAKDCSNHTSIVGVEGEDIVLSPSVAGDGNLTRIRWKKGKNIVADSYSFPPGKEKQRLNLDSSSGELFLKNLSKEDTGNYTAAVFINEKIKETCFDLKILERPDINCTINNDTIQLNCTSASQDVPLRYSWENIRNEEIISENGSVVLLQRNANRFQKITCYVLAFDSSASTSIKLSDCIPVEEPDHQSRSRMPLIAIPIILVLMLVLFCYIKKYLKKRKESKILNESESEAKNARGNCKEENSELPEEERESLTKFELESVGGKEKSEEYWPYNRTLENFTACFSSCRCCFIEDYTLSAVGHPATNPSGGDAIFPHCFILPKTSRLES